MALQHIQNFGDVPSDAELLVQFRVAQAHLVLHRIILVVARVLWPSAARASSLAIKDIASQRVPFFRHRRARLVGETHGG